VEQIFYSAKNRPQRLCKMCGKCCTMAVCRHSIEQLTEFAACEQSEAKDFLSVFVPYKDLEEPQKISKEYVQKVINVLKKQDNFKENEPVFYRCKHINPDNSCAIYEKRYGWCHRMPNHGWTLVPDGCGFEGWQFLLREQIKHNIRCLKEYLYECEILYADGKIPTKNITVAELREKIQEKIKAFERFGSQEF